MIAAVVLAAGLSRRMGRPKALLPWRAGETVIESVVRAVHAAGIYSVVVVGGYRLPEVSRVVTPLGAQMTMNPDYETGEMLSSFKVGLNALPDTVDTALIVLGDQPRIRPEIVRQIVGQYDPMQPRMVAPVTRSGGTIRRGHPILIPRWYWADFLTLPEGAAPREALDRRAEGVQFMLVEDDSILSDIDTPEEYAAERERAGLPPLDLAEIG